jgi:DNA repair exonuclease SbcCD ATPase subunit
MISGRQTLASLDSSLEELRNRIGQTAQLIEKRNQDLLTLQQEELGLYRELGQVRVEHLVTGRSFRAVEDVEQTVEKMLAHRRGELEKIHRDADKLMQFRQDLDLQREEQAKKVALAAKDVDAAEKKTQDRLNEDGDYLHQLEITRDLERTLKHAQNKAQQREDELENKGQSYKNDPLFMYLWNRKFATTEYEGKGILRWLDSKVARLIRYSVARVNYSKLREIPLRLRQHAQQVERKAEEAYAALKKLDTRARKEDGIPELEEALHQEESALAAIDREIEGTVSKQQHLEKLQTDFSAGKDHYFQQAVDFLSTELRRDDLMELREQAFATPFPEDDVLVSQLFDLEYREQDLNGSILELKSENAHLQERLQELESLRIQFKKNRYDSIGTDFSDAGLITTVLGNLINGAMTSEAFWRVLEQQRRYRRRHADPGFGSGGFGRGTIWGSGMGFPDSGGGIFGGGGFSFPGSGSGFPGRNSGGGFRTGGGF